MGIDPGGVGFLGCLGGTGFGPGAGDFLGGPGGVGVVPAGGKCPPGGVIDGTVFPMGLGFGSSHPPMGSVGLWVGVIPRGVPLPRGVIGAIYPPVADPFGEGGCPLPGTTYLPGSDVANLPFDGIPWLRTCGFPSGELAGCIPVSESGLVYWNVIPGSAPIVSALPIP